MSAPLDAPASGPPGYRRTLECLLGAPATEGNRVDLLRNGDVAIPAMLEAVKSAVHTVDFQTFVHWSGATGDALSTALAQRARAGVRVRVLLDALGSGRMDRSQLQRMSDAGAIVRWFRPLTNWRVTQSTHRGHRKVLVCDGREAFTGGMGVADQWRGDARNPSEWRDTATRLRGPAVNGLQGAFVDNWAETEEPLFDDSLESVPLEPEDGGSPVQVVRGHAETGWGDLSTLVRAILGLAQRRLRLCVEHFVPDDSVLRLLGEAVARGVTIEILRPGPHVDSRISQRASRAQYRPLLESGVHIYEYQATVLKAKVITLDGEVGVIGPVVFNWRSTTLNDEASVVILDPRVVRELDQHFDADLACSLPIDPDGWRGRRRRSQAADRALQYMARRV